MRAAVLAAVRLWILLLETTTDCLELRCGL